MIAVRHAIALCALALFLSPAFAGGLIADLSASKSGPAEANPGDNVEYTIGVSNFGPDPATVAVLEDTLPAGMTFVSLTQSSGPAFVCGTPPVGATGTVSCNGANLAVGVTAEFSLVAAIDAGAAPGTDFTNIARVLSGGTFDPNEENDAANAVTFTPAPQADVGVLKTAAEQAGPGTDITYTLVVTSAGPADATDFVLTDTLPGTLTFVSLQQDSGPTQTCTTPAVGAGGTVTCTLATLPAGTTSSFTLVANVPGDTPSGTEFTNAAQVTTTASDPNSENDVSTITTIASSADVVATKTGPATAAAGTQFAYTLALANDGPDPAVPATVFDAIPAPLTFVSLVQDSGPFANCSTPPVGAGGDVSCSIGFLPPGTSAQWTLVVSVPANAPNGTVVQNTLVASATQFDPDLGDNTASASTTLTNTADVGVDKGGPASAVAGSEVEFVVVVSNAGPDAATAVELSDTLPAGLSFVSLAQTGPAFGCSVPAVGANGTVTCAAATLASGASTTFTLRARLDGAAPDASVVTNTASITATSPDSNAANASDSHAVAVVNQADASLAKSAPAIANAGGTLSYTLALANAGPAAASQLVVSDTLPAGASFQSVSVAGTPLACAGGATVTCSSASYPAGGSSTVTIDVLLDDGLANGAVLVNNASVATTTVDPVAGNNAATASTTVSSTADLGIAKTAPAGAAAGATLAYTLTASNAGPLADAATIADTLPAGTTFQSLTQTGGPAFACTTPAVGAAGTVTCTQAAFAAGATATFTLVVNVAAGSADGSAISNTATIDGARTDPNAGNDSATATSTVSNAADLGLAKTAPAGAAAGATLTYTLTASNAGPQPDSATITDVLPAGTTFQSLTQTAGPAFACTTPAVGAAGTVTCTLAGFASGASASFSLVVNVAAGTANGSTVVNTASIDGARTDPNAANDSATATSTVSNAADLGIAKTGAAAAVAGSTLAYTLTATNGGPQPDSATITDVLPAGTTFQSLSQTAGPAFACTTPAVGSGGTVACTLANFVAGASASFALVVNVTTANANGSTLANTATIDGARTDGNAGNDSATATATVSNRPDLVLAKSGPASIVPGGTISYVIDLANAGTAAALDVVLTDPLPAQTRFTSLTQTAGPAFACTTPAVDAAGTVTCTVASFAPGASASFVLRATLATGATGTVSNSASVTTTSPDASVANNAATAGTAIVAGPGIQPVTIPSLSWLGLLALAAAVALLGAAMAMRTR